MQGILKNHLALFIPFYSSHFSGLSFHFQTEKREQEIKKTENRKISTRNNIKKSIRECRQKAKRL